MAGPSISFTAACPGCGRDVKWTSTMATVTKEQNRYTIDCETCDSKETTWDEKQKAVLHTRTVAEVAKQDMRTRANLPNVTGTVRPALTAGHGNS